MNKLVLILIGLLFLVSCGENVTTNGKEAISWMKDNKSFVCTIESDNKKGEFWYESNESFKIIAKDSKEGNILIKNGIVYSWTTKDELGKEVPNLFGGNIGDELLQQIKEVFPKGSEETEILCTQKNIPAEEFNMPSDIKFPSQMTSEELEIFLSQNEDIEVIKNLIQELQEIKEQNIYLTLQADTIIEDFEKNLEQSDIDYYKGEDTFFEINGKIFDIEDKYIDPETFKEEKNDDNKQLKTIILKNKDNTLGVRIVFFDYFNRLNDDERWKKNDSLKINDIVTVKCKFSPGTFNNITFNSCILLEYNKN